MGLDSVPLGRTGLKVSEIAFGTWRFGGRTTTATSRSAASERTNCSTRTPTPAAASSTPRTCTAPAAPSSTSATGSPTATARSSSSPRRSTGRPATTRTAAASTASTSGTTSTRSSTASARTTSTSSTSTAGTTTRPHASSCERSTASSATARSTTSARRRSSRTPGRSRRQRDRAPRGYEPFTVAQPRFNAVNREVEGNYLEMCVDYDVGVVPWSPLAGGFLTGKYSRGEEPRRGPGAPPTSSSSTPTSPPRTSTPSRRSRPSRGGRCVPGPDRARVAGPPRQRHRTHHRGADARAAPREPGRRGHRPHRRAVPAHRRREVALRSTPTSPGPSRVRRRAPGASAGRTRRR